MRRLLAFTCGVLLVETVFFAALAPLLPGFADELGLTKSEAGLLVGAYALAGFLAAIPSGFVAMRVGVKTTVVIGLVVIAGTSVAFGVVDSYWLLVGSRLAQGVGATLCWTGAIAWLVSAAPRDRRGEVLGIAFAAAIGGAVLGPLLGGAAAHFGRAPAFAAVGGLALALAIATTAFAAPRRRDRQSLGFLLIAVRSRRVAASMWLIGLPALMFGALSVLGPLNLDELGYGAGGIALTFFVAAVIEAAVNPLVGRWSDRRGRLVPLRLGLAAAVVVSLLFPFVGAPLAASVLVVLAATAYGVFWAPAAAMLSESSEAAGLGHELGFALMFLAWAPGAMLGAAAGGAVAGAAGDAVAWGALGALCAATLATLQARPGRSGSVPEPPPVA